MSMSASRHPVGGVAAAQDLFIIVLDIVQLLRNSQDDVKRIS
jgi:hypothetical protein